MTGVQYLTNKTELGFWHDLEVRLAKTFLASLGGSFLAAHPFDITKFDWATALNLATVATLTALAKGLLARESGTDAHAAATDARAATTGTPATPGVGGPSPSTLPSKVYWSAITRKNR